MPTPALTDPAPAGRAGPARVTIAPDVLFQEIEGQAVLMHVGQQAYFSLDEVGTTIWKLLIENPDLDVVRTRMLEIYDVGEADLRRDLDALLDRLRSAGLLEVDA